MILILGGSGSGKSAFAEKRIKEISDSRNLTMYYLATMQIYGKEEEKIVERHRNLRQGKNFETIEQPTCLGKCTEKISENSSALLECMSNLAANEMFSEKGIVPEDEVVKKICEDFCKVNNTLKEFVVVTNNIFDDGVEYDHTTLSYIRALGRINQFLADKADEVWECVVGIPVRLK